MPKGNFAPVSRGSTKNPASGVSLIRHERIRQVTSVIRLVGVGDEKNDVAYWTFQCFQSPIRALRKSNTLADYSR